MGHLVDVRDVARIHILALEAPPLPNREKKRLIASAKAFKWSEITEIVKKGYPELEKTGRLPRADAEYKMPQMCCQADTSLVGRSVGFENWRDAEETVKDAFESLLQWEKSLKD